MEKQREIKFRFWDLAANRMVYCDDGMVLEWVRGKLKYVNYAPEITAKRFITLEYTGLKDKNENEIYEGDIVRNLWTRTDGVDIGKDWVVKFGEYDDSDLDYGSPGVGFYCEADIEQLSLIGLPTDGLNEYLIEIIGNIYENPELNQLGERDAQ